MAADNHIAVGRLGKPHGISGAFRFLLERDLKSKKKLPNYFTFGAKGKLLPWFIQKIEWTGLNEGIILFEEIATPEKARLYTGSELMLAEKDVATYFKKSADDFAEIVGYTVLNTENNPLGTIEEVMESPAQTLISIMVDGKEALVPLVEDFIVSINKKKKEIVLDLPEGLLDL